MEPIANKREPRDLPIFNYICLFYGVPAERGRRVKFQGKSGTIVGAKSGPYLWVKLDDRKTPIICHPTWEMEYPNENDCTAAAIRAVHPETEGE